MQQQLQLLPDDVIEEILSRIEVKPLQRFRSVCKRWNTLISSSRRFASMHLKHSLSDPTMHSIINIFLQQQPLAYLNPTNLAPLTSSSHGLDPYHLAVNPRKPVPEIVGSIDGLVCLKSINRSNDTTDWLGIWNPSTKTVRELTTEPGFYAVAFGWDPVANVHKVMRLSRSRQWGCWVDVCAVQQGGSCDWRSFRIDDELGDDIIPMHKQNLIMGDGRTYCLVSLGKQTAHKGIRFTRYYRYLIACFDMVKEDVRFISLPEETNNHRGDKFSLVNWKGDLALSTWIDKQPDLSFQIWKAADVDGDQCCWTKSYVIDLSNVVDVPYFVYAPPCLVYNPATSISSTQMLFFCFGQLLMYDLDTKEYQKVEMPPLAQLQACHHVQSLL